MWLTLLIARVLSFTYTLQSQSKEAKYVKQRCMEHCADHPGGNRGDCRHWFHRNGAYGRDYGRNDGRNDELLRRYGGRMAVRASADRRNCGRSYLALAAQISALNRIEVYEQQLTFRRLHSA